MGIEQELCQAAESGDMQEADRLSDQLLASGEGLDWKDGVRTSFCAIRVKQCHCVLLPAHVMCIYLFSICIYFQYLRKGMEIVSIYINYFPANLLTV